LNAWDQTHYINGVKASIDYWRDLSVKFEGRDANWAADIDAERDAYIAALPAANKETVLTQKYIAFFNQAYQAWAEYRRTGEPRMLLKPHENTNVDASGNMIKFIPLVEMADIPRRLTYPQQEFTVNGANVNAAVTALGPGGDKFDTKLFWQP
jgi:hypothetical protein